MLKIFNLKNKKIMANGFELLPNGSILIDEHQYNKFKTLEKNGFILIQKVADVPLVEEKVMKTRRKSNKS